MNNAREVRKPRSVLLSYFAAPRLEKSLNRLLKIRQKSHDALKLNVGDLPVTWKANRKAWMTSTLFEEWLRKLDNKMTLKKRKILLLLDNAPCHPDLELSSITLFLGAATGSPYIVFISTSGMLRSSDIYIYIYNKCSYA